MKYNYQKKHIISKTPATNITKYHSKKYKTRSIKTNFI